MTDCPQWSDDILRPQQAEFLIVLRNVYGSVAHCAGRRILDDDSIRNLHGDLFRKFVPLDYFAGNYRQNDSRRICLGINVNVGGITGRRAVSQGAARDGGTCGESQENARSSRSRMAQTLQAGKGNSARTNLGGLYWPLHPNPSLHQRERATLPAYLVLGAFAFRSSSTMPSPSAVGFSLFGYHGSVDERR